MCAGLTWTGVAFEVVGLGLVAVELTRVQRRDLGMPRWMQRVQDWGRRALGRPGVVQKVEWQNPHMRVYVDVTDASGKVTTWNMEMTSPNTVRRHLTRHPMPFTFLWDVNGNATRAFQAPATSYVAVLDGQGKVVYTGVGADQDIEAGLERAVTGGKRR